MKTLSVNEFKRLCSQVPFKSFGFCHDRQVGGMVRDMKLSSRYNEIIIMLNPNRICLKNEYGTLTFGRVKFVIKFDSENGHDDVFGIVCGNINNNKENTTYIISTIKQT